jgi:hypothetical protein
MTAFDRGPITPSATANPNAGKMLDDGPPAPSHMSTIGESAAVSTIQCGTLYRFAHTIVTRKVVELGLLPQRAPFARGTSGYALNVPLQ